MSLVGRVMRAVYCRSHSFGRDNSRSTYSWSGLNQGINDDQRQGPDNNPIVCRVKGVLIQGYKEVESFQSFSAGGQPCGIEPYNDIYFSWTVKMTERGKH